MVYVSGTPEHARWIEKSMTHQPRCTVYKLSAFRCNHASGPISYVKIDDLLASLMVIIAKYNENLQSLKQHVHEIKAIRVKWKPMQDIDNIERRIVKLSATTSKRVYSDYLPVASMRRRAD